MAVVIVSTSVFKMWYITVDNNDISCAAQNARIWQFSAAYPHTLYPINYAICMILYHNKYFLDNTLAAVR